MEKKRKSYMLIKTYNRGNPPLKKIISKYWPILDRSSATRQLISKDIMVILRKAKSIKDIFNRAKILNKNHIPNAIGLPLVPTQESTTLAVLPYMFQIIPSIPKCMGNVRAVISYIAWKVLFATLSMWDKPKT